MHHNMLSAARLAGWTWLIDLRSLIEVERLGNVHGL